ncbi:MAG: hypothetical protein AB3N10_16940 [Allomuricauda sp.]
MESPFERIKRSIEDLKEEVTRLENKYLKNSEHVQKAACSIRFDRKLGLDFGLDLQKSDGLPKPSIRSLFLDILSRKTCEYDIEDLAFFYGHCCDQPEGLPKRFSDVITSFRKLFPEHSPPLRVDTGFHPPISLDTEIHIVKETWEGVGGIFLEASNCIPATRDATGSELLQSLKLVPSQPKPWLDLLKVDSTCLLSKMWDKVERSKSLKVCQGAYRYFSNRLEKLVIAIRSYPEIAEQLSKEEKLNRDILRAIDFVATALGFEKHEIENPFNRLAATLFCNSNIPSAEKLEDYNEFLTHKDSEYVRRVLAAAANRMNSTRGRCVKKPNEILQVIIPSTTKFETNRLFDVGIEHSTEQAASILVRAFRIRNRGIGRWPKGR